MAIEFDCPHCGKSLRTEDDKAGVQAKCPGCSEVIVIPAASPDGTSGKSGPADGVSGEEPVGERDLPDGDRQCPMCGERIPTAASRCHHCGEELGGLRGSRSGGEFVPTTVEIGPIFEQAWEIFKRNIGIAVAITVVGAIISFLSGIPGQILQLAADQGGVDPLMLFIGILGSAVLQYGVMFLLWAGQSYTMLKLARGEPVELSDLFRGGPYFLRSAGSSFLYLLMVTVGMLLCLVPGVFAMLLFWPYLYVIVDRDVGALEGLSTAKRLTEGNLGTGFLLGLMTIGLNIIGILMCCVGVLFTAPLCMLLSAVAYLMISGQPTAADPR